MRITSHADVVAAATNSEQFSSNTSRHLHVPNTMDGAEHAKFRAIVERYMTREVVAGLEDMFTRVARAAVAEIGEGAVFDAVDDYGARFAVRGQCEWLGWPPSLEQRLLDWMDSNHAATRAGDPEQNAAVAREFDEIVREQVDARMNAKEADPHWEPRDVTDQLLAETVDGRPLEFREIVSMLRNWTAGDLSSLAQCIGVILEALAGNTALQERMRWLAKVSTGVVGDGAGAGSDVEAAVREMNAIIDELLRINDPFLSNKRITTCPVTLPSGLEIGAQEVVLLDWREANRDPQRFGDPDAFDPAANAPHNLVYGIGPHVCPGRDLSTTELRISVGQILIASERIELIADQPAVAQTPPLGGWAHVPLRYWAAR